MKNVDYSKPGVPADYKCAKCKATGCKLYREYGVFCPRLFCVACAEKDQNRKLDPARPHEIGWVVAAIPDEEGVGYWGYTSVPDVGLRWWAALPWKKD